MPPNSQKSIIKKTGLKSPGPWGYRMYIKMEFCERKTIYIYIYISFFNDKDYENVCAH